jgi:hypothetical protein
MKANKAFFSFNHNTAKNRYNNFNSLILPYFQSDKWTNKFKDKISSASDEYKKNLDKAYIKYKNKIKLKKEKELKKKNNNEEDLYDNEIFDSTFFRTTTNLFGISDVNTLQKCSLRNMFPDYKKRTTKNFYNTKMKQSKIKRINLFPKNDYNVDDLIEKGIKYYKRGTSEEKEYQKKKYLDYIKKESENDYMKYYYNCYG